MYIGPPDISPRSLTSLYLIANIHSENLEDNPKQAEIHIQTNAPAPPETIAVATAAKAVVNAENGDTSPFPLLFVLDSLLNVFLIAQGRFLQVKKLQRIVKRIPVPTRRTSITGPHTKASTSDMILLNIYYLSSLILFSFLKCKKGATKIRCSFNL